MTRNLEICRKCDSFECIKNRAEVKYMGKRLYVCHKDKLTTRMGFRLDKWCSQEIFKEGGIPKECPFHVEQKVSEWSKGGKE